MAATIAKDDLQQWLATGICPVWEGDPDVELGLPWDVSLDHQLQNVQSIESHDSCSELSPQHFNVAAAWNNSHQISSSGPPPVSLETTWPESFLQPSIFEPCEFRPYYSGSTTASVEQFSTNAVQTAANDMVVLRSTNAGQNAMGASGAVDRATHNSKRHESSTSDEHHLSSSADQVKKAERRLRTSKRTCATIRSTSAQDSSTAREVANHAHTLVERRYRERLKVKLDQLEAALSQVQLPKSDQEPEKSQECDEDGPRPGLGRRKKSDLLHDAVIYIHQSEVDLRHLSDEVKRLNDRVRLLETLVTCEDSPLVRQMRVMRPQAT